MAKHKHNRKFSITIEELREKVDYNPETGEFWTRPRKIGWLGIFGSPHSPHPAIVISLKFKSENFPAKYGKFYAHRLAWLWMTGEWPLDEIDHINGDSTDNRWCNLRAATKSQNMRNTKAPSHNTSGYTGAYWANDRKRWFSAIAGKYLGTFKSAKEAGEAYKKAAVEMYGEFVHSRFKRPLE